MMIYNQFCYQIRLQEMGQKQSSPLSHSIHKGLDNRFGDNHCFLNVVIQSLWHLVSFQKVFLHDCFRGHKHSDIPGWTKEACVLCALQSIFSNYAFGEESSLPPDQLRQALSLLYGHQGQFQLFDMSDAAEALEAILSFIHTVYILTEVTTGFVHDHSQLETLNDIPCDFHCVSHNTFGWRCLSFKECFSCQSRSDSILTDQFIIRVHAADLMESFAYQQSENSNSTHSVSRTFAIDSSQYSLARVMQSISSYPCPSNGGCSGLANNVKFMQRCAPILALSIVWTTDHATPEEIRTVLLSIPSRANPKELFCLDIKSGDSTIDHEPSSPHTHSVLTFRGFIVYYGRHYVAFFNSTTNFDQWILFDDKRIKNIGTWDEVIYKCSRGRMQPVVLFFEDISNRTNSKNQIAFERPEDAGHTNDKDEDSIDLVDLSSIDSTQPKINYATFVPLNHAPAIRKHAGHIEVSEDWEVVHDADITAPNNQSPEWECTPYDPVHFSIIEDYGALPKYFDNNQLSSFSQRESPPPYSPSFIAQSQDETSYAPISLDYEVALIASRPPNKASNIRQLGIVIRQDDFNGQVQVVDVDVNSRIECGRAHDARDRIQLLDVITSINGKSTFSMRVSEVTALIKHHIQLALRENPEVDPVIIIGLRKSTTNIVSRVSLN